MDGVRVQLRIKTHGRRRGDQESHVHLRSLPIRAMFAVSIPGMHVWVWPLILCSARAIVRLRRRMVCLESKRLYDGVCESVESRHGVTAAYGPVLAMITCLERSQRPFLLLHGRRPTSQCLCPELHDVI